MRKMQGITVLNSLEAPGTVPVGDGDNSADDGRIMALWGQDPVHRMGVAYRELAAKIAEKTLQLLALRPHREVCLEAKKRKAE